MDKLLEIYNLSNPFMQVMFNPFINDGWNLIGWCTWTFLIFTIIGVFKSYRAAQIAISKHEKD